VEEHDRYPRTLVGTYLKDYFRRDLYVVSPEHIMGILAKILFALFMLALWALLCVIAGTFVLAVLAGEGDVLGTWLRSLEYLARMAFRW
jgi:hypothetical protein